jgi:hypothetical protein
MEIRFVVIEGVDRSQSHKSLFPVNRIFDDNKHRDGFAMGITRQKSEDFPDFDKRSLESVFMMEKKPVRSEPIEPGKALTTEDAEESGFPPRPLGSVAYRP